MTIAVTAPVSQQLGFVLDLVIREVEIWIERWIPRAS
jgi:hypothetical protein